MNRKLIFQIMRPALRQMRSEFGIPMSISIRHGGGLGRILVSAALASPNILPHIQTLESAFPTLREVFAKKPVIQVSLVGSLLAERPLLDDAAFIEQWKDTNLKTAIEGAPINPLFARHIHRLVRIQVAYCQEYDLNCQGVAPARHRDHLKCLRYLLHGTE